MSEPKFNDPKLQRAWEESREAIEGYARRLDKISADIRATEEMLRSGCPPISLNVEGGHIAWEPYAQVPRLMFSPEDGPAKPLIETKAAIRLAVSPSLPAFVQLAASKMKP